MKARGEGDTEDEMVGWHHRLDRHEFEQAPGVGEGQGSLACCSSWVAKSWTRLSNNITSQVSLPVPVIIAHQIFFSHLFLILLDCSEISIFLKLGRQSWILSGVTDLHPHPLQVRSSKVPTVKSLP